MLTGFTLGGAGQAHIDDAVEPPHRRVGLHVFTDKVRRFLVAITLFQRFREQQNTRGAGFLCTVIGQHLDEVFFLFLMLKTLSQALQGFIKEVAVLVPDPLKGINRGAPVGFRHFQVTFHQAGAHALVIE